MPDIIDDQELGEREEEADRIAGEDQRHFVDYAIACATESRDSRRDILDAMGVLWDAYNNIMDFGEKEVWQSKVITNKPFTAVERAVSIIGRAFKNPNYIAVEGVELNDKNISIQIKEAIQYWFGPQKIDYPRKFANATRMAMATGLSLEMIPRWENGLVMDWTEPWKICRDPDALPGEPWSGNYWIHEEWIDKWKLDEMGKDGYYINLEQVKEGGSPSRRETTKEEIERRKRMWWDRSTYRKAVLVREFHGVILDRQGNLLLPDAKFTIAGDALIRKPTKNPLVKLRWPGSSFAPIPHILRYDGRGLIEGVFELWKMLNKMLSLTMDDFSWVVNRMREIVPELLLDPTDLEMYPGKDLYRTTDQLGFPVVKDLLTVSSIDKILAVAQDIRSQIDNGDFVTESVSGAVGAPPEKTKGEVMLKAEQGLGIFDQIGTETEHGAVNGAYALYETMVLNWNANSNPSPSRVLGDNDFTRFLEGAGQEEKKQFLKEGCDIKIVGISAELQKAERAKLLMALKQYAESPIFAPSFKVHELVEETVGALGIYKAPFLRTAEEMKSQDLGNRIAQALGKVAQEGGPEAQAMIDQFLTSIGIPSQAMGGGNGGGGPQMPAPAGGPMPAGQ
jgi:hypothetical protein